MNAAEITDTEIKAYLLGAADADRAEEFDELAFVDSGFAARVDAVERDLVDEYLGGELDREAHRRFEAHYLRSPLRREKAGFGNAFREYLDSAAQPENPIRAGTNTETEASWFTAWWKFAIPAIAAAILLAVAIPFLLDRSSTRQQANVNADPEPSNANPPREQIARDEPTSVPGKTPADLPANNHRREPAPAPRVFAFSLSPQMRGAQGEKRVSIPSGTDTVEVTLRLEPTEFSSVRVELRSWDNGRSIWHGRARPSDSGAYQLVRFRFPKKLIGPGSYSVVATGHTNGVEPEVIGHYSFRIVP